jgi:anti-sigma-K factor RskA
MLIWMIVFDMDHTSIEELIPAYALGATDPAESQAVEGHLPSCAACRALLASYSDLSGALLFATPPMSAPRGMAERMQHRLAPPRQDVAPAPWWTRLRSRLLVPGLAFAVLLLVITNFYWFSRTSGLQHQLTEQASLLASLANASAISLHADAPAPNAQGVVYASTKGQIALLCVYGMPELPPDKAYQVWLIKDGKRESGGMFQVSEYGFGFLMVKPTRPLNEYSALGITVEPIGGSPAPTSPRVLGGSL